MKILHYCARLCLKDGGVVRAVLDMTTAISKAGKEVTLLGTEGSDWPPHDSGVQVIQTGPFDRAPTRFSKERLNSFMEYIEQTDVLHLHTPCEPANIQLAKIAQSCKVPYIISIHGMLDDWSMKQRAFKKRLFLWFGGKSYLQKAAAIHCTAEAEVAQVRQWTPRGNHVVIPYVFDPSEYLYPPPTSDPHKFWPQRGKERTIVLFLSRIHEKNGVELFLHAASEVNKTHDARFIIAGSGDPDYERTLHALVTTLDLDDSVEFVGFVAGDRKTALYRATSIFALPTSQENFGLVLPEAMACSIPSITTKGNDVWPELERSGGAFIIDGSKKQLVSSLTKLLDDPQLRSTMGNAGRSWVQQTFEGDTVVNSYISLYRKSITQ